MHGLIHKPVMSGLDFLAQLFTEDTDLESGNGLFEFTQAFGKAKPSLELCHCQGQFSAWW